MGEVADWDVRRLEGVLSVDVEMFQNAVGKVM